MCRLCDNFNFRSVAIRNDRYRGTIIVCPGSFSDVTEEDRFKFCPECGEALERSRFRDEEEEERVW